MLSANELWGCAKSYPLQNANELPQGTHNPTRSRMRTSSRAPRNPENKPKGLRSHDQHIHTHAHTHAHARTRARGVTHQGSATARERGGWGCSTFPLRIAYPLSALTCLRAGARMATPGGAPIHPVRRPLGDDAPLWLTGQWLGRRAWPLHSMARQTVTRRTEPPQT